MDTGIAAPPLQRAMRRRRGLCALLLAAVACVSFAYGEQTAASSYQIEAVYLYDFSKFVQWPAHGVHGSNDPFTICVLGEDPFGPVLDTTLSGERIRGASVVAKRISKPQEAAGCKIVFVSSSEERHLTETLAAMAGANILTVSDIRDFSKRGGMIQFVQTKGKVRFEVNVKNAENAGLVLSSDLLEVAVAVRG